MRLGEVRIVRAVTRLPGRDATRLGKESELELQKQELPIWRVRASSGLNPRESFQTGDVCICSQGGEKH